MRGLVQVVRPNPANRPIIADTGIHSRDGIGQDWKLILHRGCHGGAVGRGIGDVYFKNIARHDTAMARGEHGAIGRQPACAATGNATSVVEAGGDAIVAAAKGLRGRITRSGRSGSAVIRLVGKRQHFFHLNRDIAVPGRDNYFQPHGIAVEQRAGVRPHRELRGIERLALAVFLRDETHLAGTPEVGVLDHHSHPRRRGRAQHRRRFFPAAHRSGSRASRRRAPPAGSTALRAVRCRS